MTAKGIGRKKAPRGLRGGYQPQPVTMSEVPAPRCAGCSLFSLDLVDGQCGRCRKGKKPMTAGQLDFVREQAAMRQTKAARRESNRAARSQSRAVR